MQPSFKIRCVAFPRSRQSFKILDRRSWCHGGNFFEWMDMKVIAPLYAIYHTSMKLKKKSGDNLAPVISSKKQKTYKGGIIKVVPDADTRL
ncbi:hypothetical protein Tco_1066062, partial [Tanacetum coccineum]